MVEGSVCEKGVLDIPGFESWLYHWLFIWSWMSYNDDKNGNSMLLEEYILYIMYILFI